MLFKWSQIAEDQNERKKKKREEQGENTIAQLRKTDSKNAFRYTWIET